MITNEAQYRSTKAHLRQFDDAAAALEEKLSHADQPALARLELDAVRAQADDLRAEIDEYEQLRSGARGWTQGQLAGVLGIAEQQVQRYESTAYRAASLARICDVAAALGVDISQRAKLRDPDAA